MNVSRGSQCGFGVIIDHTPYECSIDHQGKITDTKPQDNF